MAECSPGRPLVLHPQRPLHPSQSGSVYWLAQKQDTTDTEVTYPWNTEHILEICSVCGDMWGPISAQKISILKHCSLMDLGSFLIARDLFHLSNCCLCSHPSSTTPPSSTGIAPSLALSLLPIILLISHLLGLTIGIYWVIGKLEPLTLAALRFGEEWWHFTTPTFQSSWSPPG